MRKTKKLNPRKSINKVSGKLINEIKIFCFIERKEGKKLQQIADSINRHHTTILHHLKDIDFLIETYPDIAASLLTFNREDFLQKLKNKDSKK